MFINDNTKILTDAIEALNRIGYSDPIHLIHEPIH